MKKVLAILVTAAICISFSGCSSKKGAESNRMATVRVWSGSGATKEAMTKIIDEYNNTQGKENGIKIEYSVFTSDYNTTLDTSAQNEQLPEIMKVPGAETKEKYAKNKYVVPIADMPGGSEFLEKYGEKAIEGIEMFDGKTYVVNTEVTTIGLVYNKDLFKAAGITDENGEALAPKTWEEVREDAKKITESGKSVYGISFPMKDYGLVAQWMIEMPMQATFGMDYTKIDYNDLTYDYSKWEYAFDFINGIKQDKSYFPGAESLDNDTSRAQFAKGRIGMFIGASWDVGVLTTQFAADCDWAVAPVPVAAGKERVLQPVGLSSGYCISNNALKTDKEKVMEVYKFLHSDDLQALLYEKQLSIPKRVQVVQNAKIEQMLPQWEMFGSFVPNEINRRAVPTLKLEGDTYADVLMKVWVGDLSSKEAVEQLNKTYNNALKKGVEDKSVDVNVYK